jgi:hypothetical protein
MLNSCYLFGQNVFCSKIERRLFVWYKIRNKTNTGQVYIFFKTRCPNKRDGYEQIHLEKITHSYYVNKYRINL